MLFLSGLLALELLISSKSRKLVLPELLVLLPVVIRRTVLSSSGSLRSPKTPRFS